MLVDMVGCYINNNNKKRLACRFGASACHRCPIATRMMVSEKEEAAAALRRCILNKSQNREVCNNEISSCV